MDVAQRRTIKFGPRIVRHYLNAQPAGRSGRGALLVLDTQDTWVGPVAKVTLARQVQVELHSSWLPA